MADDKKSSSFIPDRRVSLAEVKRSIGKGPKGLFTMPTDDTKQYPSFSIPRRKAPEPSKTRKFKPVEISDVDLAKRLSSGDATIREFLTAAERAGDKYVNRATDLFEGMGKSLDTPFSNLATRDSVFELMEHPLIKAPFFNSGGFMGVEDNAQKFFTNVKSSNRSEFKGLSYPFTVGEGLRITGDKGIARSFDVRDFDANAEKGTEYKGSSTALQTGKDSETRKPKTRTIAFQGRFSAAFDEIPEPGNIIPRIVDGINELQYFKYSKDKTGKLVPGPIDVTKTQDIRAILSLNAMTLERIGETINLTNADVRAGDIFTITEYGRGQKTRAKSEIGDLGSAILRSAKERADARFIEQYGSEGQTVAELINDPKLRKEYDNFKIFSVTLDEVRTAFSPRYVTVDGKKVLASNLETKKIKYILDQEFKDTFGRSIKGPSDWRKIFPSLAVKASGLPDGMAGTLISQVMGHTEGSAGLVDVVGLAGITRGHYISPVKGLQKNLTRDALQGIENMIAWYSESPTLDFLPTRLNIDTSGLSEGIQIVDPLEETVETGQIAREKQKPVPLTEAQKEALDAESRLNASKMQKAAADIDLETLETQKQILEISNDPEFIAAQEEAAERKRQQKKPTTPTQQQMGEALPEEKPKTVFKYNPQIYVGKYITQEEADDYDNLTPREQELFRQDINAKRRADFPKLIPKIIKTVAPIIAGGTVGLLAKGAEAAEFAFDATTAGVAEEDLESEQLMESLETGMAAPGSPQRFVNRDATEEALTDKMQRELAGRQREAVVDSAGTKSRQLFSPTREELLSRSKQTVAPFAQQRSQMVQEAEDKFESESLTQRYRGYFANRPN
tara:strand:+ start:2503 stop:5043 length:2541 start_codon:yes stop_codon:yes gene_type:complete